MRWHFDRREDGDYSLFEEVSSSETATETVERARFSFGGEFWVLLAVLGRTLWLVRDVFRWLNGRKNRQKGRR